MTATRFIPPGKWKAKKTAKHFLIAKKAKAETAERKWKAKSKSDK